MSVKKRIRNWLDIKDYDRDIDRDISEAVAEKTRQLEAEIWKHRHLLQKRTRTECPVCTKKLNLWPLETEAYYTRDGQAYHVACYNQVTTAKGASKPL